VVGCICSCILDNVTHPYFLFLGVADAIHHALTCAEFASLAGINVVRDFVEVPSQMLEYWLKDPGVITGISRHFETGEPMPMEMVNQFIRSGQQLPTVFEIRQAAFALLDFELHSYASASGVPNDGYEIYDDANYYFFNYSLLVPPQDNLAPLSFFGHLWGGFDAGYYGYAWSRVIAADLAREFYDAPNGFYDQEVGSRYRREILEKGNTADPNELIFNFLGRNFTSDAFFEDLDKVIAGNEENSGNDVDDEMVDDSSDAFHWKGGSAAAVTFATCVLLAAAVL
jgi:Zn-dependent oligopeptidase